MLQDDTQLVRSVLATLLNRAVLPKDVGLGAKARFFSDFVLEQLVKLYDVAASETEPQDVSVASLVHAFMLAYVDTMSSALSQAQRSAGGERASGHGRLCQSSLLRLVKKLKANDDSRQRDLVLSVLRSFPSLFPEYMDGVPYTYEPRASMRWLGNMQLLQALANLRLESALVPPTVARAGTSGTDSDRWRHFNAELVVGRLLPPSLSKTALSRGLQVTRTTW